jgi:hypothetical protein
VRFDGGISRWSGLLDMALETGHVIKPSNGWYQRVNTETGEIEEKTGRTKDTDSEAFWRQLLDDASFRDSIESRYKLANVSMVSDEVIADTFGDSDD